jgi:uncharacterized protein YybS (DUF2232 family)
MNLFDARLEREVPTAQALEEARKRLHDARELYAAAGAEVDRCSDALMRLERLVGMVEPRVQTAIGFIDA